MLRWLRRSILCFAAVIAVACGESGPKPEDGLIAEDAAVLGAVVEHGVAERAETVSVVEFNASLCKPSSEGPCIKHITLARGSLTRVTARGPWQPLVQMAPDVESDLLRTFGTRNQMRLRLPQLTTTFVRTKFVSPESAVDPAARPHSHFVALSLPAYSADNRALVFVMNWGGGRCSGWRMFLVKKNKSGWVVESQRLFAIS